MLFLIKWGEEQCKRGFLSRRVGAGGAVTKREAQDHLKGASERTGAMEKPQRKSDSPIGYLSFLTLTSLCVVS